MTTSVTQERGTSNRFIYAITMLVDGWNRKAVYRFDGGVAIGHDQGSAEPQIPRKGPDPRERAGAKDHPRARLEIERSHCFGDRRSAIGMQ